MTMDKERTPRENVITMSVNKKWKENLFLDLFQHKDKERERKNRLKWSVQLQLYNDSQRILRCTSCENPSPSELDAEHL